MLERKERMILKHDCNSWIREAINREFISILSVDLEVVVALRDLPDNFHADPADRLIAATSLLSNYPLATHDDRIR